MRPGMKLIDICNEIEAKVRELLPADGLHAGNAFPTGCSLNNVAAHWTPNTGENDILKYDDLVKFDFGVHIDGLIIDCAWTSSFDPRFDGLKEAVLDATNTGIAASGVDARLCDVGEAIQEAMESYEVTFDERTYRQVKSVENLCGHSIRPYIIHGGKSIPIVRGGPQTKMEEGECFAIETFGSTGNGNVRSDGTVSHFMVKPEAATVKPSSMKSPKTQQLLKMIQKEFGTLAFARKWLDQRGQPNHQLALKQLQDAGIVEPYPPLVERSGSYVAQYEHTIVLRPTCKEVRSLQMALEVTAVMLMMPFAPTCLPHARCSHAVMTIETLKQNTLNYGALGGGCPVRPCDDGFDRVQTSVPGRLKAPCILGRSTQ